VIGVLHTALGLAALGVGLTIVLTRKATSVHRALGRTYFWTMVSLNATALAIYHLSGRFGPFHVAAAISLVTTVAGYVPAYLRRPAAAWIDLHAHLMSWSYVGLVAAFASEIVARTPPIRVGVGVIAASIVTTILGAMMIAVFVPRTLRHTLRRSTDGDSS
jgi:uncharacterized membrane protein